MSSSRVLVVDDDPADLAGVTTRLRLAGYETFGATSADEGLRAAEELGPDAVVLATALPDRPGLEVLSELLDAETPPVVVMTAAEADVRTAVAAMHRGATEFLPKPLELGSIEDALERFVDRSEGAAEADDPALGGSSPAMRRVRAQIERAAESSSTVLVSGEPGTGKERVARAIHARSARSEGPFVATGCAAFSEEHVRAAEGGTLFVAEVAELDAERQAQLLRALETGCAARITASTQHDLESAVLEGTFRRDLFYRVNVVAFSLPPLRARRADVRELAARFLAERNGAENAGFTAGALDRLQRHEWPGNLRELRNVVERAALDAGTGRIKPEHLSFELRRRSAQSVEPQTSDLSLHTLEAAHIRRVIRETGGNRSQAARLLGVNRTTLYNKLRRYGIEA